METIAKKYIKALISDIDLDTKQEYFNVINNISVAYGDKKVSQILNSPLVKSEKKLLIIQDLIGSNPKLQNFFKVIAQ